jgi:hypothetical protein
MLGGAFGSRAWKPSGGDADGSMAGAAAVPPDETATVVGVLLWNMNPKLKALTINAMMENVTKTVGMTLTSFDCPFDCIAGLLPPPLFTVWE